LAFGVDGVEGERGFAGAGETGDHGEGIARNADVDVAQIVLASAADGDVSNAHEMSEAVFGQVSRIRHFRGRDLLEGSLVRIEATPEWERCIRRSNNSYFRAIVIARKFVTIATM
jgi:hypothetical protein